jgi:hypothetical protein
MRTMVRWRVCRKEGRKEGRFHTEVTEKGKATERHGEGNFYALRAKRL